MYRLILAAVLAVVLCTVAYADTIVLKNGSKLYGKIIEENEKEVTIQLPNKGTVTVKQKDVKSVYKDKRKGPKVLPPSESPMIPKEPEKAAPEDTGEKEPVKGDEPVKTAPAVEKEKELGPEEKKQIEDLVFQLGHNRTGWRTNAIAELTKKGKPAVPFLIKALESGKKPKQRWGAALVLGDIGDKRAREPLVRQLRDDNQFVRKYSVEALRKITKQNFGYDPEADASARAAAAGKWEEWWEKTKEEEKKKEEEAQKPPEEKEPVKKPAEKEEGEKKEAPEEPPGE